MIGSGCTFGGMPADDEREEEGLDGDADVTKMMIMMVIDIKTVLSSGLRTLSMIAQGRHC